MNEKHSCRQTTITNKLNVPKDEAANIKLDAQQAKANSAADEARLKNTKARFMLACLNKVSEAKVEPDDWLCECGHVYSLLQTPPPDISMCDDIYILCDNEEAWRKKLLKNWRACSQLDCKTTWCGECFTKSKEMCHNRICHPDVVDDEILKVQQSAITAAKNRVSKTESELDKFTGQLSKVVEATSRKRKQLAPKQFREVFPFPRFSNPSEVLQHATFAQSTPRIFNVKTRFTTAELKTVDAMFHWSNTKLAVMLATDGDERLKGTNCFTANFQKENMAIAIALIAMSDQLALNRPRNKWDNEGLLRTPDELNLPTIDKTEKDVGGVYIVATELKDLGTWAWVRSGKAKDFGARVKQHFKDVANPNKQSRFHTLWRDAATKRGLEYDQVVKFHIGTGLKGFEETDRAACLLFWSTQTKKKLGNGNWPTGNPSKDWRTRRNDMFQYLMECTYGLMMPGDEATKWTESFGYEAPRGGPRVIRDNNPAFKKQKTRLINASSSFT